MAVAFNKFNCFVADAANKIHNLGSDALYIYLTNVQPVATNTVYNTPADLGSGGPGFAGFEVTRHKEAIIPASDYDLLASGGSFFSLSFPSSFSAKRRRICKGGKFYTKLTKAGFGVTRRKKPPLDDEEEFVAPRAKVSRPRHAHVLEEDDDEEALVMMIWGMK